jgi:hypothetical protein
VKKVKTAHFSFPFSSFFTLWREQFVSGVRDGKRSESESHRGKNSKSGGSDPTFSAFSRPKSSWGRSRPSARFIVPGVFSTVTGSSEETQIT